MKPFTKNDAIEFALKVQSLDPTSDRLKAVQKMPDDADFDEIIDEMLDDIRQLEPQTKEDPRRVHFNNPLQDLIKEVFLNKKKKRIRLLPFIVYSIVLFPVWILFFLYYVGDAYGSHLAEKWSDLWHKIVYEEVDGE